MELLVEFLLWWRKCLADLSAPENVNIWQRTNPAMQAGDWTPEHIIRRYRQIKFTRLEFDNWMQIMTDWARAGGEHAHRRKKRGIYKPKNLLDGFLRGALKGKYKWRRYKEFSEYLQQIYKHTKEETDAIITKYQATGVEGVRGQLAVELANWKQSRKKLKATKAANVRWEEYRKKKTKNSESSKSAA
jgi:hypothetical protein